MARLPIYRFILFAAVLLGTQLSLEGTQSQKGVGVLTVEEVVKLLQAGFSEELIVTKIKANGKAFNLSTEELLELRKIGINDTIVKFLLDPSQPYIPPPPPQPPPPPAPLPPPPAPAAPPPAPVPADKPVAPPAPAKKYPDDANASKVPAEPGFYRFVDSTPQQIDLKTLFGTKEGAGFGKVLMKKGQAVGYLIGRAAKSRTKETSPEFYIRLAEGKGIEDIVLVVLESKSDRREIELGPPGPKPELKAEVMRPFDPLEVGPHLYRINTGKIQKGEYFFLIIGSADPAKGISGKGYDFGIDQQKR
jgi:hypothetical protein